MIRKELIIELFEKQKNLDKLIIEYSNVKVKDIFDKKILAFIVEVCEFLNEEKSFKYWKKTKTINRNDLVEEYIDGIHFLLSICVDFNLDFNKIKLNDIDHNGVEYQALTVIKNAINYQNSKSENDLVNLLCDYLYFIEILKISEDELLDAYNKKNKINQKRQVDGY